MPDFRLPDLGEGVTEAEIDRWLVKEGDEIQEDDPLVEVITDKATAEIPSPFAGRVSRLHFGQGDVVPVGSVMVTVSRDGEDLPSTEPAEEPGPAAAQPAAPDAGPVQRPIPPMIAPDLEMEVRVKAMPPVRKLARSLGVDLGTVAGSGPQGRVLREDVERIAGDGRGSSGPKDRRVPLRGVRRKIAERMSEAHRIVPPVTHVEECDVTELEATRSMANDRSPELPHLTFMPFIVKAVVRGLKDFEALNASLDEKAGEIVFHDRYDIGVAVDTPQGLTVVVIRDADKKRLREIAADIDHLASAARSGSLTRDDLADPTFTISSPGKFGGLMATPIVFHPQSAILGVHRADERPVVRDGQIVIRTMMNLSITFDHRIMDGMTAARFVLDVVRLLEHPAVLALES
jgi:pyruvate/2-oxoglutarate dehydrogenase complex dihydrolipoamide acyltransferase (E2) component